MNQIIWTHKFACIGKLCISQCGVWNYFGIRQYYSLFGNAYQRLHRGYQLPETRIYQKQGAGKHCSSKQGR